MLICSLSLRKGLGKGEKLIKMKHISIIIFISLIAFGSFAINTTTTFSEIVEKASDAFKASDASETSEKEESLPTFLQLQSKYEYNKPKMLFIKPIGLKSGETPYKSLILMNKGGLEVISAYVENGQVKVKKFENNSFNNYTQTTFDIDFKTEASYKSDNYQSGWHRVVLGAFRVLL